MEMERKVSDMGKHIWHRRHDSIQNNVCRAGSHLKDD